jgi:uncharacterized membrane protein
MRKLMLLIPTIAFTAWIRKKRKRKRRYTTTRIIRA